MIMKLIIRVVTILLTLIIGFIVEISILGYSLECIKTIINRDFDKYSNLEWLKLSISLALAIGQILLLIIWAWA